MTASDQAPKRGRKTRHYPQRISLRIDTTLMAYLEDRANQAGETVSVIIKNLLMQSAYSEPLMDAVGRMLLVEKRVKELEKVQGEMPPEVGRRFGILERRLDSLEQKARPCGGRR